MVQKYAVLGGDVRNIFLAKKLQADGAVVNLYGVSKYEGEKITECKSLQEAVEGVDFVIGGIPCSNDRENLNTPFSDEVINIKNLFNLMTSKQTFFAGRISENLRELAKEQDITSYDILDYEEMAILNAIPTAEGAIKIAIEETDITLHDSNVMVIGFGRIGKILCKILSGFSAKVYVVVHKAAAYAEAKSYGYNAVMLQDMNMLLPKMDIIMNTVPKVLLNSWNLHLIKGDCFILDLASKPFGIDYECSKNLKLKVLWAPSLPGKIAANTAANYIKQSIARIIEEDLKSC